MFSESAAGMPSSSRFASLVLALLLVLPAAASAQTIYSYTDENGVTHFTDRKPDTDIEVRVQRATPEPRTLLTVRRTGPDEAPVWWFQNRTQGPLAVRVDLADAFNVVSEPALPGVFVLEPGSERELVTIGAFDPRRSWRYQLKTETVPGRPGARHNPEQPYRLPLPPEGEFLIGQAFGGEFSHNEPANYHAVDISMPIGTPVHAARAGVVMDKARWFSSSGTRRDYHGHRANYVRILHDDGSMAVYAHLDYNGVSVRPGQQVRRGQVIGRSGNTGFSTGPHLHFVVQVNRDMQLVSVPFEFQGPNGEAFIPRAGRRVSAVD
ncbi:MAG: DUF4124 domain-containing protein [Wenzhouxiangellaceae bacterium]|nr:MAG: DUF4124 domain-containing protein [Wenzhouxiangellaceae bacterium]